MRNPVFTAVNSRYNHTNLALRSIASYVHKNTGIHSILVEKTTSEPFPLLLRSVCTALGPEDTGKKALLLFSVYIWNAPVMFDLAREVKKIFPHIILGCGGPEVSYNAAEVFEKAPDIDFIIRGEGEASVLDCVKLFNSLYDTCSSKELRDAFAASLAAVPGIYIHKGEKNGGILFTGERDLLCSLDELCFPYPSLRNAQGDNQVSSELPFIDHADKDIHIFYYESSRGCPFRCSYCLSSIDKKVRFLSLDRVYEDLQVFLDTGVSLVKFVDRTFNLDENRYLSIWRYIIEHHNGVTMFHFEIAAEQCSDAVLDFLQKVPQGVMQFEVGVQTMNPKTLLHIHRPFNKSRLETVISRIPKTIHLHLDLIAGLPHEDLSSFRSSFDQTIALKPDMLQLGFLKILHGTEMEDYAKKNGLYQWLSIPPYEVLRSPSMSYEDLMFLKDIEHLCDAYYNSGNFKTVCSYLIDRGFSLFDFFSHLVQNFRASSLFDTKHTVKSYAAFLYSFIEGHFFESLTEPDLFILKELLRFDFLKTAKPGSYPQWFMRHYSKDMHHKALQAHTVLKSTREAYSYSEYEEFEVNPHTYEMRNTAVLFLYPKPQEGVKGFTKIIYL